MVLVVKNLPASAGSPGDESSILGWEDPLEWEMATHSSIPAWEISWKKKPGRVKGPQRVGHD